MQKDARRLAAMTSHETLTLVRLMKRVPDAALRASFGIGLNEYRVLANVEKGFERTSADLARRLGVVPSRVAAMVSRLERMGLITSLENVGKKRLLSTTAAGSSAFRTCRRIIQDAYRDFLSPLTYEEHEAFEVGTLATAFASGDITDVSQSPDKVYLCIQAYSLYERICTKHSRNAGISFCGLTVLYALSQEGPMSQAELAKALALPKSSLCEHVHDLAAAGYVSWGEAGSRPKVKITNAGLHVAHETVREILEELAVAARATADVELLLFVGISRKLVAHAALR